MSIGLKAKHNQAAAIVAQLSVEDKARLSSGRNFWHLEACVEHDLPSVMVTDGPHGLRKQDKSADHVGLHASVPATCFPTACALASSWNPALLERVGAAMGAECVAENVSVLLGPGLNIKRHPLCGRNFEYLSEDPWLNGKLAAALVRGVQSQGVGTSIKHFAVNNQENGRMVLDAIVDERTLREIYLRGFEIAVKEAQPWTVMCAYNRINGTYCSDNKWLLNDVLRDEWGFQGLVMTDWGATNERVTGVRAGLDLEMPGSGGINDAQVLQAVQTGTLDEKDLDAVITRNVALSLCGADVHATEVDLDLDAHHNLAREAAAECCVLLKNESLLPLNADQSIAVIGGFATRPRFQGAGSSQVNPTRIDNAWDAFAAHNMHLTYAQGYDPKHSEPDQALIEEAVTVAREADVAVVFAGLPGIYESEGFDRAHMDLPQQHNTLIAAVCAANPNTVVVLSNGAPVAMPWVNAPAAILEAYLGGQASGSGVADVLFGVTNPSGKLAETFPVRCADVPSDQWFTVTNRQVQYREGLYVGYRYFDSAAAPVLFPFGHGLSYTTFEVGAFSASADTFTQGSTMRVGVEVTNVGERAGAETLQIYVHRSQSEAYRPEQELKAFSKVFLTPGETRLVEFILDDNAFNVFDSEQQAWIVEAGIFQLRVGTSSRAIHHGRNIEVQSDHVLSQSMRNQTPPTITAGDIAAGNAAEIAAGVQCSDAQFASLLGTAIPAAEPVRPYHLNSSILELAESWLGERMHARIVKGYMANMGINSSDETLHKMFTEMANNMPLRALALFSRGQTGFADLEYMLALLNHQFVRALQLKITRNKHQRSRR